MERASNPTAHLKGMVWEGLSDKVRLRAQCYRGAPPPPPCFIWQSQAQAVTCASDRSWPQIGRRQHNRWRKKNQESGQSLVLFARMVLPALLVFGLTWLVWASELETKETCDTFTPEHLTAGVKASGELELVAAPSARVPGFLQWADLLFLVCMNYIHTYICTTITNTHLKVPRVTFIPNKKECESTSTFSKVFLIDHAEQTHQSGHPSRVCIRWNPDTRQSQYSLANVLALKNQLKFIVLTGKLKLVTKNNFSYLNPR